MAKLSTLKLSIRAEVGATFAVPDFLAALGADGEPPVLLAIDGSPVTLTFLGIDAPVARRFEYARAAALQTKAWASHTAKATPDADESAVTADEIAEQHDAAIEKLVALTTGWHGFEDDDDQPVPFTREAVQALYDANPLLVSWALAKVGDRQRFFAVSRTGSASSSPITLA